MTLHLLDANVLIRAHEDYYPIDRIPQFWSWLLEMAETATIKMPIQIYNEIALSRGSLADWLRQLHVKEALVLSEPTNLARVQNVLVRGYAADLTDVEIEEIGQDPFLVAAALNGADRVVVTREASKPSAQRANRRIPEVCMAFGITAITD
ncbi:MAG: DUF4411 family protein [Stellaceae bacterium]